MPRFAINDTDAEALVAYLRSEPVAKSPGVSDTTLHFAIIVTEGVDPAERKAMLDVLEGYFRDKNANTRHDTKRGKFSAYKMYQVYRQWQLHLWELTGPEDSWPDQLEKYYRAQPVLAMVSGLSAHGWQPIHRFCERFEVACLFPNTDVPDYYSVYFSKGLTGEAEALAKYLHDGTL